MVYFTLFITALISATLFPLGSEALLIYDIKEGYNLYLLLLFATIGNSLGSVINYFLGLKGEEYLLKTGYEIIILPVTIRVVNYIKKVDGSDVYDENISYNVLKIKEL